MQGGRKPGGAKATPHGATPRDLRSDAPAPGRILAIGDLASALLADLTDPDEVTCLPLTAITAEALARIRPEVVISLLVGPGFDCLDVAERLTLAGYRGKYRAVAPEVPNRSMVRREITDRFPDLDFDLVVVSKPG